MKAAVSESFRISGGKAAWHNRAEQGQGLVKGEAFYVPANAPPEFTGVLARALLKAPGHKLRLLPAGEAGINSAQSLTLTGPGGAESQLTRYEITGLDVGRTRIWLDHDGNTAATLSGWFAVLPATMVSSLS